LGGMVGLRGMFADITGAKEAELLKSLTISSVK